MLEGFKSLVYGEVIDQDLDRDLPHYRVRFTTGEKSSWIPALTTVAGNNRKNLPLSKGTQVAVLFADYDGLILGALNCAGAPTTSDRDTLDRVEYGDGTWTEYDTESNHLTVNCVGSVTVKGADDLLVDFGGSITVNAGSDITVNAPSTTLNTTQTHNGDVSIKGNLNVSALTTTGGLVSKGTAGGGGASISGNVKVSSGDVTADGISLKNHTHPGDSGGTTGSAQ